MHKELKQQSLAKLEVLKSMFPGKVMVVHSEPIYEWRDQKDGTSACFVTGYLKLNVDGFEVPIDGPYDKGVYAAIEQVWTRYCTNGTDATLELPADLLEPF